MSAPRLPREPSPPSGTAAGGGQRFAGHLASAGELVAARRFREAEIEVLRAISGAPADLRALNLLALVRFKLGRLEEARATYREIATLSPKDPAVRRNLGLLALKVERFDEAITELEMAARLAPTDKRAWSYLGYAYTRRGDALAAVAAFRRAGQDAIAAEIEAATVQAAAPVVETASPPAAVPAEANAVALALPQAPAQGEPPPPGQALRLTPRAPEAAAPTRDAAGLAEMASAAGTDFVAGAAAETRPVPVVAFVLSALGLGADPGLSPTVPAGRPLRLSARDGAHVRADATLASVGAAIWKPGFRRLRGRRTEEPFGTRLRPFYRLNGAGEVWVAGAANRWVALALEDDIIYVREERVLAFDGAVAWEAGRIPGDGLHMLQFRGRGHVALQLSGAPSAIRVSDGAPALVSRSHLLGWVGRVVAYKSRQEGPLQITCEGDGVMLLETRRSAP